MDRLSDRDRANRRPFEHHGAPGEPAAERDEHQPVVAERKDHLAALGLAACQPADRGQPHVVEVIARDYAFDAPAEIPSGWTTFRMKNEGQEHHFLLLNRLPDGKTFEEYVAEVGLPFDSVWHELKRGAIDKEEAGAMLGRLLPAWYASVEQDGRTRSRRSGWGRSDVSKAGAWHLRH